MMDSAASFCSALSSLSMDIYLADLIFSIINRLTKIGKFWDWFTFLFGPSEMPERERKKSIEKWRTCLHALICIGSEHSLRSKWKKEPECCAAVVVDLDSEQKFVGSIPRKVIQKYLYIFYDGNIDTLLCK
jgi:hypothetical protein